MRNITSMSAMQVARLIAHPEYSAVKVGMLSREDLSHDGDWAGSFDELKQSIAESGIQEPLRVFFDQNGEKWLLNGHHRAVAAFELGLERLPVKVERA